MKIDDKALHPRAVELIDKGLTYRNGVAHPPPWHYGDAKAAD
jgi:hypothetical protein